MSFELQNLRSILLSAIALSAGACSANCPLTPCPAADSRFAAVHFNSYFDVELGHMSVDAQHPAEYDTCVNVAPGKHSFNFTYNFEQNPDRKTGIAEAVAGSCSGSIDTQRGMEYSIMTEFEGATPKITVFGRDKSVAGVASCKTAIAASPLKNG